MSGRTRSIIIAASLLILWTATAVAGLAETLHALDHRHEAEHGADDHWQRVSLLLVHGHEHALDTPEHEHPVVSATPATVPLPRHRGDGVVATLDVQPTRSRPLLPQGWLTPPTRPSPNSSLLQTLCILLI